MFSEQFGRTTTDTKAALVSDPVGWLRATFSLWNRAESLGDLQNQAYGYIFPMGSFFAGLHALGIPLWMVERFWSLTLIVVACEGIRRVAREVGLTAWPALFAGFAYAISPKMLSEIGVRSAELGPTAMLPWVLLSILLVLKGRLTERTGALLAAAAFLCSGAVNATATVAPLALVVIVIVWGIRSGLARRRLLAWWAGLTLAVSLWWVSALVLLQGYSPPFFDYVEDARTTTSTAGFDPALRGMSYWVGYLTTGGQPTWPAAWSLAFDGLVVLGTGVVAVTSLVGLARWRSSWRTPFVVAAIVGLVCITVGHTSTEVLQSPLAPSVQRLLDHPFAILRNITKIDPVLRLPLALGFGAALEGLLARRAHATRRRRTIPRIATVGAILAGLVVSMQPVFALNLRTPGWTKVPSYWTQAADWLARAPHPTASWVLPGSGFAIQSWGSTFDEPMSMIGKTPWVSRSQAPLVPAGTMRMLDGLQTMVDSGLGSPHLGAILARTGIGYVVVRHDLATGAQQVSTTSLDSLALARSGGLHRVATFGEGDFGPRIEIYRVGDGAPPNGFSITPTRDVLTVASDPSDALALIDQGVVSGSRATVVRGDSGWSAPAQVVGDGDQLRMRQFGLSALAEGPVLSPTEPRHSERSVGNYPASAGAVPVTARYFGIDYVDASSSQGFTAGFGPVLPEDAPYSAVDADPRTFWRSAPLTKPQGQWLAIHLVKPRALGRISIIAEGVQSWRVDAGSRSFAVRANASTGIATLNLGALKAEVIRFTVTEVTTAGPISVSSIQMNGLPASRSLVLPRVPTASRVDFLFQTAPETRPCVPTVLGPDCEASRYRPAEEGLWIDRTITVNQAGQWGLSGTVVATTSLDPDQLSTATTGVTMHASSTYFGDPGVAARMAYDGNAASSWIAAPTDRTPSLMVSFPKIRTISRVVIEAPAPPAVPPTQATLIADGVRRVVPLTGLGSFAPIRTKNLRIVFSNPSAPPGTPLGVAEVQLQPGSATTPIHGAAQVALACGLGPTVYVDGHAHPTKVTGVLGDVVSGGRLGLSLCGPSISLSQGTHRIRIRSTDQVQPVSALLTQSLASSTAARTISNVSAHTLTVGPGPDSILSTTMNANAGWVATLNGRQLRSQIVNGWAQGWEVPAGQGGVISLHFAPQNTYVIWLIIGLVIAGLLLLAAIVALLRRPKMDDERPLPQSRPLRGAFLIVPVAWVLAGLPGLIGGAIAIAVRRRGIWLALPLALAGPIWTAWQVHVHGPSQVPELSNVLSGIGVVILLASSLVRRSDDA
jgi:arabinofuranan 3-O-arabinosyltransferase